MKKYSLAFLFVAVIFISPIFADETLDDYDYNERQVNIDIPYEQPALYDSGSDVPMPKLKSKTIDYENSSEVPEIVIAKYPISEDRKNHLKYWHEEYAKMRSNDEAFDGYVSLFNENPTDYLAAYLAAKRAFDMARFGTSKAWCEIALKVNPKYRPAKRLYEKAKYRSEL